MLFTTNVDNFSNYNYRQSLMRMFHNMSNVFISLGAFVACFHSSLFLVTFGLVTNSF